jgi:serine/threonine-protein kinase
MAQVCPHCHQVHPAYTQMCPATGMRIGLSLTMVSEDVLLVGSVVGDRWLVKEMVGQGQTGTVFFVDNMSLGRPAAMKVLRPRYAGADILHRVFQGEAHDAWLVTHPCIVEVLDAGTLPDGAPYFVMERLEGETLASRVKRERLSTGAAVDVMMQILSAIDALHQRDMLVRDLRPQNVFLASRRGCRPLVKLTDLGLARLLPLEGVRAAWDALMASGEEAATAGALAVPYYLSPERALGEHEVDRSSDIFIAMVLFFEMLTGEKPFTASTFDGVLEAILNARAPRISDLRPDVPSELDALFARTLSSDQRARPSTARELQEEIRAVFDGAGRRGSSAQRAAPVVALPPPPVVIVPPSLVDSSAHTPLRDRRDSPVPHDFDDEPDTHPPSMVSITATPGPMPPETVASQQLVIETPMEISARPAYEDEITRMAKTTPDEDEASAEAPHRTVRPRARGPEETIDVDIDDDSGIHEDPQTSRGQDFEAAMRVLQANAELTGEEREEETETMQLTSELRARIEQLARAKAAPAPVAPSSKDDGRSSKPPPTRRLR